MRPVPTNTSVASIQVELESSFVLQPRNQPQEWQNFCPCLSVDLHQGNHWEAFFCCCCGSPLNRWHWVILTFVPMFPPTLSETLVQLYIRFWIPGLLLVAESYTPYPSLLKQNVLHFHVLRVFRSRNRNKDKFSVPLRWVKLARAVRNGLDLFSKWN